VQEEHNTHLDFNKASQFQAALTSLQMEEVQGRAAKTKQVCSSGQARRWC
jgi:hypothetical protein